MREHQIRQCIVCRQRAEKEDLFRITWIQGQGLTEGIQAGRLLGGRGFYLHPTSSCTRKMVDPSKIARALRLDKATVTLSKDEVQLMFSVLHRKVLEQLSDQQ